MTNMIQKFFPKNNLTVLSILLLSLSILLVVSSAYAYIPASHDEMRQAKQLEFKNLFSKLSSGGLAGNLGSSLLLIFALLIPSFIAFIISLRFKFRLLKVLQFPALICIGLGIVVLFFQPQRWLSGDWAAQYVTFTFFVGVVFGLASINLMRTFATLSALWSLGSLVIGLTIYAIRALL